MKHVCTCGHLACVCRINEKHKPTCKFRISATCPVGIECEHGYDVCPICDPCTCEATAMTPITPCGDRIVVEPLEPKVGSIIIAEKYIHDHIGHREGIVLAVGPGKVYPETTGRIPLHDASEVVAGSRVAYHKWGGSEMTIHGKKVVVLQASDILGVFEADEAPANKFTHAPEPLNFQVTEEAVREELARQDLGHGVTMAERES